MSRIRGGRDDAVTDCLARESKVTHFGLLSSASLVAGRNRWLVKRTMSHDASSAALVHFMPDVPIIIF